MKRISQSNRRIEIDPVDQFKTLVQGIGIGIGGNEEYDIRALGSTILAIRSAKSPEDLKTAQGNYDAVVERLSNAALTNHNIEKAVLDITVTGEMILPHKPLS